MKWTDTVRRADPAHRRPLREAMIALGALRRTARDTGDTAAVFEVLENFPVRDVLAWHGRRLAVLDDPRLATLWRDRSMPDLTTAGARRLLTLPRGTLGHEYACWFTARGLDNLFLENFEPTDPGSFLMKRTAHLHDLFHFVLGYDPYDPIGEMEIEAFLLAQTGGLNHVLFLMGYAAFLLRSNPAELRRALPRLRDARRLGRTAEPVLLQRWEALLVRPLDQVKRELGIAGRPEAPTHPPPSPPKLAHTVLNVDDLARAEEFYRRVLGYQVSGRDPVLGAVFLTDGDDHHTIALQERPRATLASLRRGARRLATMVRARQRGTRSAEGQRRAVPPWPVIRAALRPGLNHTGYRVASETDLRAYVRRLRAWGARVVWAVNHADLIRAIYVVDPAGNLIELFVDTTASAAPGSTVDDVPTFDLDRRALGLA